ncbi:cytosolic carboxypeptidase 4, partial [Sigmodon hispidus]
VNYRCSGISGSNSSSSSRSSEVDDEPFCMEEIDYSADSSADPEQDLTELDRQIQECAFDKDEEEDTEKETG